MGQWSPVEASIHSCWRYVRTLYRVKAFPLFIIYVTLWCIEKQPVYFVPHSRFICVITNRNWWNIWWISGGKFPSLLTSVKRIYSESVITSALHISAVVDWLLSCRRYFPVWGTLFSKVLRFLCG